MIVLVRNVHTFMGIWNWEFKDKDWSFAYRDWPFKL